MDKQQQKVSEDGKRIFTGDRDEKLRISTYPRAYNIEAMCLGHRRLVTGTIQIGTDRLVSTSGDGTVRLWRMNNGEEEQVLQIADDKTIIKPVAVWHSRSLLVFLVPSLRQVVLCSIDQSTTTIKEYQRVNLSFEAQTATVDEVNDCVWLTSLFARHLSEEGARSLLIEQLKWKRDQVTGEEKLTEVLPTDEEYKLIKELHRLVWPLLPGSWLVFTCCFEL